MKVYLDRWGKEPTVYCPGCRCLHRFNVYEPNRVTGAQWTWNGDTDRPTFSPSLIVNNINGRCHSFLRDGIWEFLSDCSHDLAGLKIELTEIPEDF